MALQPGEECRVRSLLMKYDKIASQVMYRRLLFARCVFHAVNLFVFLVFTELAYSQPLGQFVRIMVYVSISLVSCYVTYIVYLGLKIFPNGHREWLQQIRESQLSRLEIATLLNLDAFLEEGGENMRYFVSQAQKSATLSQLPFIKCLAWIAKRYVPETTPRF